LREGARIDDVSAGVFSVRGVVVVIESWRGYVIKDGSGWITIRNTFKCVVGSFVNSDNEVSVVY